MMPLCLHSCERAWSEDWLCCASALHYILLSPPFAALTEFAEKDFMLAEIIHVLLIGEHQPLSHPAIVTCITWEAVPGHPTPLGLLLCFSRQKMKAVCGSHPTTHLFLLCKFQRRKKNVGTDDFYDEEIP